MTFLEKDLETIIFETPNEKLFEKGLYILGKKKRQVRIGNYGIADLITAHIPNPDPETFGKHTVFTIYELKQQKIGLATFMQAIRYAKGIKSYLEKRRFYRFHIDIVLIGREFDINSDFVYLSDFLIRDEYAEMGINLDIYKYSYDFDGIKFDQVSGYSLINEGFVIPNKRKLLCRTEF